MPKGAKRRTTISLPKALYERIVAMAKDEGIAVNEVLSRAVQDWVDAEERVGNSVIAKKVKAIWNGVDQEFSNPYQVLAANWRADRTLRQIEAIKNGRVTFDALPGDLYLTFIIQELMTDLAAPDVFRTISNFRCPDGTDVNIASCTDLCVRSQKSAVERGVHVHRIFLLVKEDFFPNSDRLKQEVQCHCSFQQHLEHAGSNSAKTTYVDLRAMDRQTALMRYGHFGFITRNHRDGPSGDADTCVIQPGYTQTGQIRSLELIFSQGPGREDPVTRYYWRQFEEAAAASKNIAELANELGLTAFS